MARTAAQMTPEEWRQYRPLRFTEDDLLLFAARWRKATQQAKALAQLLYQQFGAQRVCAFGSITRQEWFGSWSDIDLAAWGIASDRFLQATSAVQEASDFPVDLVAVEFCQPKLRERIEQEGILL